MTQSGFALLEADTSCAADLVNPDAGFPLLGGGFAGNSLKLGGAHSLSISHHDSSPLSQESPTSRIAHNLDPVWSLSRPLQETVTLKWEIFICIQYHG